MALDGIFLRHITSQIRSEALSARITQIYQPNREEIVIALRGFDGAKKLLISTRANSPRIHFTNSAPENPPVPPMFCMLLRKKLGSGKLVDVRQNNSDRTVFLDFDTVNELGDCVRLTVAVEIMGKYSNIVLFNAQTGIIIDALKRVDMTMSNLRLVLPNLKYETPPAQDKLDLLVDSAEDITNAIISNGTEMALNKAILSTVMGSSPLVCREIENNISNTKNVKPTNHNLDEGQQGELLSEISRLAQIAKDCSGTPVMLIRDEDKPFEFCFMDIKQYGGSAVIREYPNFSQLLDSFYIEKDTSERMRCSAQDLFKLTNNLIDRLSRKINTQQGELTECKEREKWRIYGDLLQANLYRVPSGSTSVTVENFYDENYSAVTIPLNPAMSPSANAQKFYNEYRKLKTGERILSQQIEQATQDLIYINSVADELSRATSEKDLAQIRLELTEQGFLKAPKGKQKPPASLPPIKFITEDNFTILVGRNNLQNDKLTLKLSNKSDIWFHTKDIHGSHAVLVTEGREPSDSAILSAAMLAAYHSKARGSTHIEVDYTLVRYVSKPIGSKPGKVIYTNQKSLVVDAKIPDNVRVASQ